MLSPETAAFLESGCALIVGTADIGTEPHATRGWGVTVLSRDPGEVRLLIDANDPVAITNLSTNGKISVTGADVPSLASVQFKGTVSAIEAATDEDRARAARYADAFFGDIGNVDGTPRKLVDRLLADDFVACIVRIVELYDQTPGPGAGASMSKGAS
ncbi:MAG: hypothetical protein QOI44_2666 [Actinomycetota bacterium]|nr:hypothetical protein [Actinomycetota bacterium]